MSLVERFKEALDEVISDLLDRKVELDTAREEHRALCSNPGSEKEKSMWEKVQDLSREYTMLRHRLVQFRGKLRMAEVRCE